MSSAAWRLEIEGECIKVWDDKINPSYSLCESGLGYVTNLLDACLLVGWRPKRFRGGIENE